MRPLTGFLIFILAAIQSVNAGQSLGEVARQQQQKKGQQQDTAKTASGNKKIYTNEDLPKSSPASDDKHPKPEPNPTGQKKPLPASQPSKTQQEDSVEQFKAKIQKQKAVIAELREEIGKLEPTINFVQNNRNIYTNAPEYNQIQKERQMEVERLKSMLEQQESALKDLQEQAREAGLGNAVYE